MTSYHVILSFKVFPGGIFVILLEERWLSSKLLVFRTKGSRVQILVMTEILNF